MNRSRFYTPDSRFTGRWIGATQGYEMPAHIWEISQYTADLLYVTTRWENDPRISSFFGHLLPQEDAFAITDFKAVLVDPQHFIISGWDTNDVRNDEGPDYDVVFSRPGLAELVAHEVWLRYKAQAAKT